MVYQRALWKRGVGNKADLDIFNHNTLPRHSKTSGPFY